MVQPVPTKLSLAEWASIAQVNPLQFWGVAIPEVEHDTALTDNAWLQYGWQTRDALARDELAQLIASAESDIELALGYHLLPDWTVDEWRATPRPYRPELYNLNGRDVRGQSIRVHAQWGYFISGGVRASTLVAADAPVTYSNTFPPATYPNQATVSVTVDAGQDPQEIHVYYPDQGGDPRYEIRPVQVSIVGTTATITFRREMAVVLTLLESLDVEAVRAVDGTVDANFLTAVDVFRVYNDPSTQATLQWSPPYCASCGGGGCAVCGYVVQDGCLTLYGDPRHSDVGFWPGTWDAATETFAGALWAGGRAPDIARLSYYSGWRDKSLAQPLIQMDRRLARCVAIMAAARMRRSPTDYASRRFYELYSQDMAYEAGGEQISRYRLPLGSHKLSLLENPFGTRRGEIEAWQIINTLGLNIGVGARAR